MEDDPAARPTRPPSPASAAVVADDSRWRIAYRGHGDVRLAELEDLLSHDEWEPVAGREHLWAELEQLLVARPELKTHLTVPEPEELEDGTRLIEAIWQGRAADYVAALLADGADVNERAKDGDTPLLVACVDGDAKVVTTLLAAKADVNKAKNDGTTRPAHPQRR